jgi:hypothetical protein
VANSEDEEEEEMTGVVKSPEFESELRPGDVDVVFLLTDALVLGD